MTPDKRSELRQMAKEGKVPMPNTLIDLIDALESAEKSTIKAHFNQLDSFGGGEMALTTKDEDGKVLTVAIFAKGQNAEELVAAYEGWGDE